MLSLTTLKKILGETMASPELRLFLLSVAITVLKTGTEPAGLVEPTIDRAPGLETLTDQAADGIPAPPPTDNPATLQYHKPTSTLN